MRKVFFAIATIVLAAGGGALAAPADRAIPAWIAATSFDPAKPRANEIMTYDAQSARQDAVINTATTRIRLRLTNEYGAEPVTVDHVDIRRVAADGALGAAATARFDGAAGVTIEPGTVRYTDTLPFAAPAFSRLAITVHYPGKAAPVAHRLMIRVGTGTDTPPTGGPAMRGPAIVSAIETEAAPARCRHVIVALGDSITEGAGSTENGDWPSRLARRLAGKGCDNVVVNAGISGNRVLTNGGSPAMLARLDRDVLAQPGITDIVFVEGVNDVRGLENTATDAGEIATALIAAYRQLVARAHARGIRVIGGTLVPYKGTANQTALGLDIVELVNARIRAGGVFDVVVDFNRAMADPADPQRMRADWQRGDWLHPNDAGYATMAAAIPVALFADRPK